MSTGLINLSTSGSATITVTHTPTGLQTTVPVTSTTGSGLSGLQVIGDDYTTYANNAAFQNNISTVAGGTGGGGSLYKDGVNANLASIDTTVLYNGHQTAKYTQPGGVPNTPQLWANFPTNLNNFWFRGHVRFSNGFTTTGTNTGSASAYKLFGWGYDFTQVNGSGRCEITNVNQYDFYWGVASKTTGATTGGGQHSPAGAITTEWTDQAWYTYIIQVVNNGNAETTKLWRGRESDTPTLRATTGGTMLDGTSNVPSIYSVEVGINFNQTRVVGGDQALWWGDWEVVDGSIHPDPYNLL